MKSFDNVMEKLGWSICNTNYEKENGIKILSVDLLFDGGDIKFVSRKTSDGKATLIIVYKISVVQDFWEYWVPSDNQFKILGTALLSAFNEITITNGGKPISNFNAVDWRPFVCDWCGERVTCHAGCSGHFIWRHKDQEVIRDLSMPIPFVEGAAIKPNS